MGVATLGFAGGPKLAFRIDPNDISWNFKINTSVVDTLGGRVVQVLGATLSDVTIRGSYGENHYAGKGARGSEDHPGASWRMAEVFVSKIREMQKHQAEYALLSTVRRKTAAPAVFHYPPKGWRFACYIKDIADPDGGNVTHRTGKFSYEYVITLFVEQDSAGSLVKAGSSGGVIDSKRQQAIESYIARISDGIGWHISQFNGPPGASYARQAVTGGR